MTIFHAILLGIVEGVTEYLPISSTFHLILTSKILGLTQTNFLKTFEVVIQGGAILTVLTFFTPKIIKKTNLLFKLSLSFIPTAIVGVLLYKTIKNIFFENFALQLSVFALVGVLFILFEKIYKPNLTRSISLLTNKEAILIGLVQALAVIPGVSRAGAVILGLMFLKIKREEAAEYSFLLAVPTLLAAAGLDLIKSAPYILEQSVNINLIMIGFLCASISSYLAIKWLVFYLQKNTLVNFGIYRLILTLLILIFFNK